VPFWGVESVDELRSALSLAGASILKTRRFGYDGKGQVRLETPNDAANALSALNGAPAILEGFVAFSMEISVIVTRGMDGQIACFDPGQNVHEGGILRTTTVPAPIPAGLRADAVLLAARIAGALDYVGTLGVELFVTPKGLIVNEIAPRVHNSGHWTQEGCAVDQFEQHIRAIAGLPLNDAKRSVNVTMTNLIGHDIDQLSDHLADPRSAVHLYGKAEARPGRKMGHVNKITGPA